MMRPNPFLLLIGVLEFSVSDLYANRRGSLTDHQRAHLEQRRLREIEAWTLALVVLLLSGAVLQVRLMIVTFGTVSIISIMLALWMRYDEDFRGEVQAVSGRMQFKAAAGLPFHPHYHLLIDSEWFRVSPQIRQAFDAERHYRLYYTPGTRSILSAEIAA